MMNEDGNDNGEPVETPTGRYDEELLSANWNPVIALLESCAKPAAGVGCRTANRVREEDVDDFLGRIYALGA